MSKLYYGSICFSDLHEALKAAHSAGNKADNGKIYVNVNLWINDEKDKFGNIASLVLSPKKDSGDDNKIYIGNLKESEKKEPEAIKSADVDPIDDLPF
jgi:hypothetical protein